MQKVKVIEISMESCGADMSENRVFPGRTGGYPDLRTVATRSGEGTAVRRRRLHHKAVHLERLSESRIEFESATSGTVGPSGNPRERRREAHGLPRAERFVVYSSPRVQARFRSRK